MIFPTENVFTQKIEKFKDTNTQKWGLKNTETDSVIVPALFPRIHDFNDTLIIVNDLEIGMAVYNHSGELLIDYDNRTLFTFMDLKIGDCSYDSMIHGKLFDVPMFNPRQEVNMRGYEINLNRECIPNDYFLCPGWTDPILSELTPEYITILQRGEKYSWNGNIDSAIFMCQKAIELHPDNPAVYHWGASLFVRDYYTINDLDKKSLPCYLS
ncbi:MAG: hypothetical protein HC905_19875 [Bacteroidales bacterium]|nr:hypothetical protein [Bacteroidales bacterium]